MKKHHLAISYKKLEYVLIGLGVTLFLLYVGIYVYHHWQTLLNLVQTSHDVPDFLRRFRSRTLFNFIILIGLSALSAAVPFMSNAAFAIFNGLTFGPFLGFIMNLTANLLGNFVLLKLMNRLALDHGGKKSQHINFLEKMPNPKVGLFVGYLFPFIPTLLVNYRATEMDLTFWNWLAIAGLGLAPVSLIYALGGDAILKGNIWLFAGLVVVILLAFIAFKFIQKGREKHGFDGHSSEN